MDLEFGAVVNTRKRAEQDVIRSASFNILFCVQTGVGIANLLCDAMIEEGASHASARNRCYLFDVNGLLALKPNVEIPSHSRQYFRDLDPEMNLVNCISKFKATCLIGETFNHCSMK